MNNNFLDMQGMQDVLDIAMTPVMVSRPSIEMVKEFHTTFNKEPDPLTITITNQDVNKLRINLLQEELNELKVALDEQNTVEVLDALTDLQYVLDGAYLAFGMAPLKNIALEEVHASNMSKLGADGKAIHREDGKILKGPNYWEPNLKQFIFDPEKELDKFTK